MGELQLKQYQVRALDALKEYFAACHDIGSAAGAFYRIEVRNPQHKTGPDVKIVVDGVPLEGNLIARAPKGTKVKVDVTII